MGCSVVFPLKVAVLRGSSRIPCVWGWHESSWRGRLKISSCGTLRKTENTSVVPDREYGGGQGRRGSWAEEQCCSRGRLPGRPPGSHVAVSAPPFPTSRLSLPWAVAFCLSSTGRRCSEAHVFETVCHKCVWSRLGVLLCVFPVLQQESPRMSCLPVITEEEN